MWSALRTGAICMTEILHDTAVFARFTRSTRGSWLSSLRDVERPKDRRYLHNRNRGQRLGGLKLAPKMRLPDAGNAQAGRARTVSAFARRRRLGPSRDIDFASNQLHYFTISQRN